MTYQADVLKESRKNAKKIILFGNVCSYFGQYSADLLKCAGRFSRIAQHFAEGMTDEIRNNEKIDPEAYWKQAQFYGYALLCHTVGYIDEETSLQMVKSVVLYRNRLLYSTDVKDSLSLDSAIEMTMTRRADSILDAVRSNRDHLTHCLRSVIESFPTCTLSWDEVTFSETEAPTGCFSVVFGRHLYVINILNGTVLIDGAPPGLLPSSVVYNSLYQQVFGTRNFEVIVLGADRYLMASLTNESCLYEYVVCNTNLQIIEHAKSREEPENGLLLLRRQVIDLPPILREGYSHWYSGRHRAICVRRASYTARNIEYVVTECGTYIIPYEFQCMPLEFLLEHRQSYDRMLRGETSLLRLLHRIEEPEYIHLSRNPQGTTLLYELPRYKLEFEQTNEGITSLTFKGFFVPMLQVLGDTLYCLSSFLLFRNEDGRSLVLIPSGKVASDGSIERSKEWNSDIGYHVYDEHSRFRHLVARDSVGRLHLASLYAAAACFLPERRSGKSCMEVACSLVRQCWKNELLTDSEEEKLAELSGELSNLCPTLRLLCTYLWKSSNSVRFLHTNTDPRCDSRLEMDPLARDEYRGSMHAPRLMKSEENYLFSLVQPQGSGHSAPLAAPCQSDTLDFIKITEEKLAETFLNIKEPSGQSEPFPLSVPLSPTGVAKEIFDDLRSSWDTFTVLERYQVCAQADVSDAILDTELRRERYEKKLLGALNEFSSAQNNLFKLSGRLPLALPNDLLVMPWDDKQISKFNPAMNDSEKVMEFRHDIIHWMLLCCLEDKLRRMHGNPAEHLLLTELQCVREWDPWKHPEWLAFELEQQIQIRTYQYKIVKQLLENPGGVIQLNMGLGKTSVLVPMLILELRKNRQQIVRINLLASILRTITGNYRSTLTASVLHVKIFTLPYHRDVPLENYHADVLTDEINSCQESNGVFVVSPQHRNSLLLKQYDQNMFVSGLTNWKFHDIIDESDAILDHSFQLVYAVGDQSPLPDGDCRWRMIEAFLIVLARTKCPLLLDVLSNPRMVHREARFSGSFPNIRLLSSFFDEHRKQFEESLCRQLIVSAPVYELHWMKRLPSSEVDLLVKIMSDGHFKDSFGSISSNPYLCNHLEDILIARGCIAYGLLFHGLRSRYRVHFGLHSAVKKMAVPFAASDTPKLRSEFSHPDMAILYTCLSYYHEGLSRPQFREALVRLQALGPSVQENHYSSWIDSVRDAVNADDLAVFDKILKVDVDNPVQIDLMHAKLHSSMEVVSFWMNEFVFPESTHQFPDRRVTSAWNLVDSGSSNGFSGTDDNRFLLPLTVKQLALEDSTLRATNAEMIDRVLQCTNKDLRTLEEKATCSLSETVLCECLAINVNALIDVGGLMAGMNNRDAAEFLATKGENLFPGVVYYDSVSEAWNVYEQKNKRHLRLKISSLHESECFVFYDESRCRGSDMKLKRDAAALVTLAPGIPKDAFLQGCARMRQLRPKGQSIYLAGTSEVLTETSTVKTVLEFVIKNTIEKNRKGVYDFVDRGINHAIFPETVPLQTSLSSLYVKDTKRHASLSSFVQEIIHHKSSTGISERTNDMIRHCVTIDGDISAHATKLAEECEREIESEELKENEEEIQAEREEPFSESDWEFAQAFSNPNKLFADNVFVSIRDLICRKLSGPGSYLGSLGWSEDLYCTMNFWSTVVSGRSPKKFMRPVNCFLSMFGRVVLISEYEAENLLPFWWEKDNGTQRWVTLNHISLVDRGADFKDALKACLLPTATMTSMKLFRGYVSFRAEEQLRLLEMFRRSLSARSHTARLCREILTIRDRIRYFERSDLEAVTIQIEEPRKLIFGQDKSQQNGRTKNSLCTNRFDRSFDDSTKRKTPIGCGTTASSLGPVSGGDPLCSNKALTVFNNSPKASLGDGTTASSLGIDPVFALGVSSPKPKSALKRRKRNTALAVLTKMNAHEIAAANTYQELPKQNKS